MARIAFKFCMTLAFMAFILILAIAAVWLVNNHISVALSLVALVFLAALGALVYLAFRA